MDNMVIIFGILAGVLALLLTPLIRRYGRRAGVLDRPETAPDRKLQRAPVPLLGGLAVYGAFLLTVFLVLLVAPDRLLGGYLLPKHLVGILLGGLLLMIGGYRDDRKPQSPRRQILWPIIAALAVIASGIGITYLSNPFGAPIRLDHWSLTLFSIGGVPYHVVLLADFFAFLWLLIAMYTTKFLDGLDGLVSGVSVIGMVILFFLSGSQLVGQPETALLAIIAAGSFLGFLAFNFHPASIFLGEGGSLFAGFLLGALAIVSGGKIATALLILGIPMLDVLWVIGRRLVVERHSAALADRKHLHFRLLDLGLSHRSTVLLLYCFTAVFGSATLFFHGKAKVIVLAILGIIMFLIAVLLTLRSRGHQTRENDTTLDSGPRQA